MSPGLRLSAPEALEPIGRQLRVFHSVLDVLVTEIGLQRPGVVTLIGQGEATCMTKHVRVNFDLDPGNLCGSLQHPGKPGGGERRATLR